MLDKDKSDKAYNWIVKVSEREFDPNTTKKQLMVRPNIVGSWGAHRWANIKNKALIFMVTGAIHEGLVIIVLGWNDVYKVYLLDHDLNQVGEVVEGVYCDMLVSVIDGLVETPKG